MPESNTNHIGNVILTLVVMALPGNSFAAEPGISGGAFSMQSKSNDSNRTRIIRHITDVTGRKIRIIGNRFYANPQKSLNFPGKPILQRASPGSL